MFAFFWVRRPLSSSRARFSADGVELIVSLTTYPARVSSVAVTLRSLLMQSQEIERIILVLSEQEFPEGATGLPRPLQRLTRSAKVELLFTPDNTRSFKKLLPVARANPDAIIITADDDVIYTRNWAKNLMDAHRKFPAVVVGTRGSRIVVNERSAEPYGSWAACVPDVPSHQVFLTGRGGILYPPHGLSPEVQNWAVASRLCSSTDDIWFKAMATLAGTKAVAIDVGRDYPSSGATQHGALYTTNVDTTALNDIAFKLVLDEYDLWRHFQPPLTQNVEKRQGIG